MQLRDKSGTIQTLRLLDASFVDVKRSFRRSETIVSCAKAELNAAVTDAARAFLGMAPAPKTSTSHDGSAITGPPPAVFEDAESGAIRVLHREIRVCFAGSQSAAKTGSSPRKGVSTRARNKLLDAFSLKRISRRSSRYDVDDIWTVKSKDESAHGAELIALSNELAACEEVEWATPHFVSSYERQMPDGFVVPLDEWHLQQISAPQAWVHSTGKRTVVAVIDDGVDIEHRNLLARIKYKPDRNEKRDRFGRDFFVDEDSADHFDPRPKVFSLPSHLVSGNDIHGTACAGLVVAEGLAIAGPKPAVGVAPKARLLPVKVFHGQRYVPDSKVAQAIRYASRFADVLSCSWTTAKNPDVTAAIAAATTHGRNGRGCPVVFAVGNHGASSIAYPSSLPTTIAVAAISEHGARTSYSNAGDVDVCAPSSGGARSVYTTDWSIPGRGFNASVTAAGAHTDDFGGTSAACPQVAGVIALMLSRRPSLTVDDVREILVQTADSVAGPGHNAAFGFGRVNALRAVLAALAR